MKKIKIPKKQKEKHHNFHIRVPMDLWSKVFNRMQQDDYTKAQEFGIALLTSYVASSLKDK